MKVSVGSVGFKLKSSKIPSPEEHADILINHYTSISRLSQDRHDRIIRKQHYSTRIPEDFPAQVTSARVKTFTKQSGSSKRRGLDNMSYAHLNHVGPTALTVLTVIFNLSLKPDAIPIIWKIATIIPTLKPGKDPRIAASFRPISLLSNIS